MLKTAFNLRPSKQLFFLCMILMGVSEIILWHLSLPISLLFKLFIGLGIFIYSGYLWRRQYFIRSIQVKDVKNNTTWVLSAKNKKYIGILQKDSTVTRIICILRFHVEGRFFPITCLIFRDTLLKDEYRQLLARMSLVS